MSDVVSYDGFGSNGSGLLMYVVVVDIRDGHVVANIEPHPRALDHNRSTGVWSTRYCVRTTHSILHQVRNDVKNSMLMCTIEIIELQ